jgi:hypothetical protein
VLITNPGSSADNNRNRTADQQWAEVFPNLFCPFRTEFLVYLANETVVCHGPAVFIGVQHFWSRARKFVDLNLYVLALLVGIRAICKTCDRNNVHFCLSFAIFCD